jgi:pyruvate/2-oxoglutarate dehydrogenase complex dihydrolipoamide acyltransferase (E2) component
MMNKVIVPKRGMGVTPFTIVEWKHKEGDKVERGHSVVTLESEKVIHEVETESSGYLHILFVEGSEVPIGTTIAMVAETEEEMEKIKNEEFTLKPTVAHAEQKDATKINTIEGICPQVSDQLKGERLRISPVARSLAQKHGIDIASIKGTGPGGSVVKTDVELAIESAKRVDTDLFQGKKLKATIPLKGMRKTIAEHMHKSLSFSAQVTVMGEIDMSEMMKVRESMVKNQHILGSKISYTDLFVFLTSRVLKDNEILNSSLIDNEIKIWDDINIGVATALDDGLIVPVVKGADKKNLADISRIIKDLVSKAREGKVAIEDVTGGTFTITNLGALGTGYRFETVIINQPESAILGTGGITKRVVVKNNEIVVRPLMTYYLTYDHRVMNGADAAKFLKFLVEAFENPESLINS